MTCLRSSLNLVYIRSFTVKFHQMVLSTLVQFYILRLYISSINQQAAHKSSKDAGVQGYKF